VIRETNKQVFDTKTECKMKYFVIILALLTFPLSTNVLAGSCGGDHTHSEDTKKDKRVGA